MNPNRDALHSSLRSSLSDFLLDLGTDNLNVRPAVPQSSLSLHQAQLGSVARGAFDSPFLPAQQQQQSLLSHSLGLASPPRASMWAGPTLQTAASALGLTPDGILLAAAAAGERSKLLEQAKASLIQQQNAEEYKRLLLQKSYLSLLQEGSGFASQALLPQLARPMQTDPALISGVKALEALGNNLRAKSDPYIDVSSVADPDPEDGTLRRTRGGVSERFPEKLHRMLSDVEKDSMSDVVSFFSHGRAFGVHDMEKFVSEVMPKYFKQTKWNSFARQLNLYGFIRITSGPDTGGYYNELFLKGRPNLCLHMRRVGVPQGEDRRKFRPKNTNVEPDFYSMKPIC